MAVEQSKRVTVLNEEGKGYHFDLLDDGLVKVVQQGVTLHQPKIALSDLTDAVARLESLRNS
jgi:hypothetical protein